MPVAAPQVSDLKSQFTAAKAQQDKLKTDLDSARSSAEAARKREAQLRREVEELRFLMDEAHSKADEAQHGVSRGTSAAAPAHVAFPPGLLLTFLAAQAADECASVPESLHVQLGGMPLICIVCM